MNNCPLASLLSISLVTFINSEGFLNLGIFCRFIHESMLKFYRGN
jgi:hypothetical protein